MLPDGEEIRAAGTKLAWEEYLEATKGLEEPGYSEAESWAWARLEQRLEQLAPSHAP